MSPSSKRALIAAGTVASALAIVVACGPGDLSGLTRGDPQTETPPPADDSGLAPIPTCKGERPPPPPNASNDSKLDEVVFAFDNLRIDADTANNDAGLPVPKSFNLDNNCACNAELSCGVPDGGLAADLCDDSSGRDNATGKLIAALTTVVPTFRPQFLKERINAGAFSVLISLLGWNGRPDDPNVFVGVRMSTGNGNPINPEVNDRFPLKFDGTDTFSIDPASIAAPPGNDAQCDTSTCVPKALDLKGYVTGNKVVARFESLDMAFLSAGGRVVLPFKGATIVAEISGAGTPESPWRLAGELAGRWTTTALLGVASAFNIAGATTNPFLDLCKNDDAYNVFKASICTSADVAADPASDNKRGVTCGALSEAISFTAVTAKLGAIRPPAESSGDCRPPDTCP